MTTNPGGSSGIGLATVKLLLDSGAHLVVGDQTESPLQHANLSFLKTNVALWTDLLALFKLANSQHGRIDHVFANAGITGRADYFESKVDEQGELLEPSHETLDINLRGMINTSYLGIHYMRNQTPAGGSIVCTASASSFQRFHAADYTTAKHGVLGFMRGTVANIKITGAPIRINSLAPSWTVTGMIPPGGVERMGAVTQPPEAVARNVALFMADEARQGQLVYSVGGRYYEIEEAKLLPLASEIIGKNDEEAALRRLVESFGQDSEPDKK